MFNLLFLFCLKSRCTVNSFYKISNNIGNELRIKVNRHFLNVVSLIRFKRWIMILSKDDLLICWSNQVRTLKFHQNTKVREIKRLKTLCSFWLHMLSLNVHIAILYSQNRFICIAVYGYCPYLNVKWLRKINNYRCDRKI